MYQFRYENGAYVTQTLTHLFLSTNVMVRLHKIPVELFRYEMKRYFLVAFTEFLWSHKKYSLINIFVPLAWSPLSFYHYFSIDIQYHVMFLDGMHQEKVLIFVKRFSNFIINYYSKQDIIVLIVRTTFFLVKYVKHLKMSYK